MLRLLTPDVRVRNVTELTLERLRAWELTALLLDVDCTLKRYRSEECTPEALVWLAALAEGGIGVCLLSNGLEERIGHFAAGLHVSYVARAMKPLPTGCRRAAPGNAFSAGAHGHGGRPAFRRRVGRALAGLTTILVEPLDPAEEPWFTRLKRPPERWLLKHMPIANLKFQMSNLKSEIPESR